MHESKQTKTYQNKPNINLQNQVGDAVRMSRVLDGGDVPDPSALGCSVVGESTLAEYYRALQVCAAERIISGYRAGGGDGQVAGGSELRGRDAAEVAWRTFRRVVCGRGDSSVGCEACGCCARVVGAAGGDGVARGFTSGGVAGVDQDCVVGGGDSTRGVGEHHGVTREGPVAVRVEGVSASVGVGPRRGPNYLRNKLDRERKKLAKQQRLALGAEVGEAELVVRRAEVAARGRKLEADAELAEARLELERMRVVRALRAETEKKSRYEAGFEHVTEALRLAKEAAVAVKLGELAQLSKVAGWAATVTSRGASSVALSSPVNGMSSVASAASATGFAAAKGPLNVVESLLVENSVTTEKIIRSARAKVGRALGLDDVFRPDAPFRMSGAVKREIALAGAGLPKEDGPFYG